MYSLDDATGMHGKYTVGCVFFFLFYPPRYAEWAGVEPSRAGLISPQATAARPVVGG